MNDVCKFEQQKEYNIYVNSMNGTTIQCVGGVR